MKNHGCSRGPGQLQVFFSRCLQILKSVPVLLIKDKNVMIFYDDPVSITNKCTCACRKKIRGVMIWPVGSDYMDNRQPQPETIGKMLEKLINEINSIINCDIYYIF